MRYHGAVVSATRDSRLLVTFAYTWEYIQEINRMYVLNVASDSHTPVLWSHTWVFIQEMMLEAIEKMCWFQFDLDFKEYLWLWETVYTVHLNFWPKFWFSFVVASGNSSPSQTQVDLAVANSYCWQLFLHTCGVYVQKYGFFGLFCILITCNWQPFWFHVLIIWNRSLLHCFGRYTAFIHSQYKYCSQN